MKEEINVKELIEIFEDMAKRETLLARGGVTQEDLLIQNELPRSRAAGYRRISHYIQCLKIQAL